MPLAANLHPNAGRTCPMCRLGFTTGGGFAAIWCGRGHHTIQVRATYQNQVYQAQFVDWPARGHSCQGTFRTRRIRSEMKAKIAKAIKSGREQEVAALLQGHPELLQERDLFGQTPLYLALDRPQVLQVLLQAGASVQVADREGQTPLHQAEKPESVRLLLSHGARVDATNAKGATPLHRAVRRDPEVLRLLLEAGADPKARAHGGETPLHWAAREGYSKAIAPLLQAGADLEAVDDQGRTPFQLVTPSVRLELTKRGAAPPAPVEAAPAHPPLRLGLVHSMRGIPEAHVVEVQPGDSLRSILQGLKYPADLVEVSDISAPSSPWKSAPRFPLEESAEGVTKAVNPLSRRLSPEAYDDLIVIGRTFVFVREGEIDPDLLQALGVTQPAIIPRFAMSEAGYASLDQRLDPCARPLPTWQPHLHLAPLSGVFAPHEPVCALALCQRGSQRLPSRAQFSLRDGGDYSLSATERTASVKEGLLVVNWPPNLRQVCSREPVDSGSEKGFYQALIEWGDQEARWCFTVGSYRRPRATAEWVGEPRCQDGLWSARLRLRGRDGKTLPPGLKVKVVLDYFSVEPVTFLDGVVHVVDLQDSPSFPHLEIQWSPKEKWTPERESRTWDDWQQVGLDETAILPLPRCDVLERGSLRLSPQKFPGSQSVSGLEVGLAQAQSGPLQPLAAVSEQLQLRASRPIQLAAVTVLDSHGLCRTTRLGPLAAGETCEVDLSQVHGSRLYVCLGALHENQIHEVAFPFFRPPTVELHYQGPTHLTVGQAARPGFRLKSSLALPGRVLMVVQDARLDCPFERDLSDRKWADLMMLLEEVEGQQPPLFSQAWLHATLQLSKKRGAKLPDDCGPARPMPGQRPASFLVGPPATNPERRWSRMDRFQTVPPDFSPQPAVATLVKVRAGLAQFSWVAPHQPGTVALYAFTLDSRGSLVSCRVVLSIDDPSSGPA